MGYQPILERLSDHGPENGQPVIRTASLLLMTAVYTMAHQHSHADPFNHRSVTRQK